MSAASFQFDIVSPERKLLSKSVVFATLPTEEGYVGVLPGHTAYVFQICPGLVDVFESDPNQATERFFVVGGFAEVKEESCALLAEEIYPLDALNLDEIAEEVANLEEDYALAEEEEKRDALEAKLYVARAKLEAAKGRN